MQPQGEAHITSAQGETNIALVEIDRGPYLVRPLEEAFDNGERPVNVAPSNLIWVRPPGWADAAGPRLAWLWGSPEDGQKNGTFVRLPAGFVGSLTTSDGLFRAVVIQGSPLYLGADIQTLEPGSALSSAGSATHPLSSPGGESILYVHTEGRYDITAAPQ